MQEIQEIVSKILAGYDNDPADNDFQSGYKAAIEDLRDIIAGIEPAN